MKSYYLMVHFDGGAVTGFLAFGVNSEEEARKKVLKGLLERKSLLPVEDPYGKRARVKQFIKALNHPWRFTRMGKSSRERWRSDPTIQYLELTDQVIEAGHWLSELKSGEHYCNLINR